MTNPISTKIMQDRAIDVCEAVRVESTKYQLALMTLGAAKCRDDIRALPAPTDAEVLAAAEQACEDRADRLNDFGPESECCAATARNCAADVSDCGKATP